MNDDFIEKTFVLRGWDVLKRCVAFVAGLKPDPKRPLGVTVGRYKRTRSEQQNRFWWGVYMPIIGNHIGVTKEVAHELVVGEVMGETTITFMGKPHAVRVPTHNMTVEQFSELIERTQYWAAEVLEIALPDPRDMVDDPKRRAA